MRVTIWSDQGGDFHAISADILRHIGDDREGGHDLQPFGKRRRRGDGAKCYNGQGERGLKALRHWKGPLRAGSGSSVTVCNDSRAQGSARTKQYGGKID